MKKVVYYARVSTEEEGQLNAIENQINMLEDFISNNSEWKLVDKYVDRGKSGTSTKGRNEYNKLLQDLETDKFDIIVVKDQSRLNRNVLDYYTFIDRLAKNEKQLFLYTDNQYYKADDTLINGIKALLSAEYSRDISKKVNSGNRQKQKQGVAFGNSTIWGYDRAEKGKYAVNESEAEIIKKIFNWYVDGKGFRLIYKMLEDEGIKNRNGNPFSITTLKRIIQNEKYKGVLVANKRHKNFDSKKITMNNEEDWIIHKGGIPSIVSEEIWDKANDILKTKKRKREDKSNDEYIGYFKGSTTYAGKIFCAECGSPYWHGKTWGGKSMYQCKEYSRYGVKKENGYGCVNYRILEEELNYIMKEIIYSMLTNKDNDIKNVIDILEKVLNNNNEKNDIIDKLEKDKNKLQNRKSKLIDMLADDLITKQEFQNKKENIDDELYIIVGKLSGLLEQSKNTKSKADRIKDMKNFIDNTIVKDKNDIDDNMIKSFLDKVIVKNENELEITINGNVKFEAVKRVNQFTINQNVSNTRYNWTQTELVISTGKGDKIFKIDLSIAI